MNSIGRGIERDPEHLEVACCDLPDGGRIFPDSPCENDRIQSVESRGRGQNVPGEPVAEDLHGKG